MSKQAPPAPIASAISAISPCPTIIQIIRTHRYLKFTLHQRTSRLSPNTNTMRIHRLTRDGWLLDGWMALSTAIVAGFVFTAFELNK